MSVVLRAGNCGSSAVQYFGKVVADFFVQFIKVVDVPCDHTATMLQQSIRAT